MTMEIDLLLVGGGLASGLVALRLAERRPEVRVAVVEAGERLGGNHVWSSFEHDLTAADRAWTAPLVVKRWPGYSVAFPEHRRRLATGYASMTSDALDRAVRAVVPAERLLLGAPVEAVGPTEVKLADGRTVAAKAVVDGRGALPSRHVRARWQKFVGRLVETEEPHGLAEPVVMDATVEQLDGYRFVYLLPFSPTLLLIEDTYYSDTPDLDVGALGRRIEAYADGRGWRAARVVKEETGVLAVVLDGDVGAYWDELPAGVPAIGARGLFFHPTTGYSFPEAVRVANLLAGMERLDPGALYRALRGASEANWARGGFYRMLDRMLFLAASPAIRYRVLQRFYRLDERLIGRFYAGRSTLLDKARILIGRPPVPIGAALRALPPGAAR